MNMDVVNKNQNWISEGLLIAAIPVVSYGVAFVYEAGFALYFSIPLEFIDISIANIVMVLLSLFLLVLVFLPLTDLIIYPIWRKLPRPVRSRSAIYIPVVFFYITSRVLDEITAFKILNLSFAFVAIGALLDFVRPLLMFHDKRSYLEKLDFAYEIYESSDTILNKLITIKNVRLVVVFFLLILILWLSFTTGVATARYGGTYYVMGEQNKTVVLRKYGDMLITARLNELTKEVLREHVICKINGEKLSLRVEKLGQLKLEKEKKR